MNEYLFIYNKYKMHTFFEKGIVELRKDSQAMFHTKSCRHTHQTALSHRSQDIAAIVFFALSLHLRLLSLYTL